MTPKEINSAIARIIYPDSLYESSTLDERTIEYLVIIESGEHIIIPNYCEDMNLLMPLCFKHGIGIHRTRKSKLQPHIDRTWVSYCGEKSLANKSPQIALATCLLKVLEAKANEH